MEKEHPSPSNYSFSSHEQVLSQAESVNSRYPTIGLIGGLGPDATNATMQAITDNTRLILGAQKDQDHLRVLAVSNPQTPDRTGYIKYLLGLSDEPVKDPFPYLVSSYLDLKSQPGQQQKVKYVGIPCNTAHFFADALQKFIDEDNGGMKIVHMIEEVNNFLRKEYRDIKKVGLLATSGTIETQLYQRVLEDRGYSLVTPDIENVAELKVLVPGPNEQKKYVMEGIYGYETGRGVKAGFVKEPRDLFRKAAEGLRQKGAQAVIEGCTEIPLAFNQTDINDMLVINPTDILARRLVELTVASL